MGIPNQCTPFQLSSEVLYGVESYALGFGYPTQPRVVSYVSLTTVHLVGIPNRSRFYWEIAPEGTQWLGIENEDIDIVGASALSSPVWLETKPRVSTDRRIGAPRSTQQHTWNRQEHWSFTPMLTLRHFATMNLFMAPRLCPNSEIGCASDFRMRVFQHWGLLISEGRPVFQTRVLREWAETPWRESSGLRPCR